MPDAYTIPDPSPYTIPVFTPGLIRLARLVLGDDDAVQHMCGCEMCLRTSLLCPASASSLAHAIGEALEDGRAEKLIRRASNLETKLALALELIAEYEAQWGTEYLAVKWGLPEQARKLREP